jgi:hypothetical protein
MMGKRMAMMLWALLALANAWGQQPQQVSVTAERTELLCPMGGRVQAPIVLRNPRGQSVVLHITQEVKSLSEHQQAGIDWGREGGKGSRQGGHIYTLPPHGTAVLQAYFATGFNDRQEAEVVYHFSDMHSHARMASVAFRYRVAEPADEALLYVSHEIHISNLHPNPVVSTAAFTYQLADDHDSRAVLQVHNVLGKMLATHVLDPAKHTLELHFDGWKPGVYFYTLLVGEESVVTKKFILKR